MDDYVEVYLICVTDSSRQLLDRIQEWLIDADIRSEKHEDEM